MRSWPSPSLLLLDEPSLGLSPKLAKEVVRLIGNYSREHGLSVLLVEQNARLALGNSDRGYVIETGRIVAEGSALDLRDDTRRAQGLPRVVTRPTGRHPVTHPHHNPHLNSREL